MNNKSKKLVKKYSSNLACAYPYLYEDIKIVDHEVLTDEISAQIAVLYNYVENQTLKKDLEYLAELAWHIGGSVRGKNCINKKTVNYVIDMYKRYESDLNELDRKRFTVTIGSKAAAYCELVRNKFKSAVRNLYLVEKDLFEKNINKKIDDNIYDILNICSNLFYLFSLWIRIKNNEEIKTFVTKSFNLKVK